MNAPAPSWAVSDASARQRSESLSQATTSGGGLQAGKLLQHGGHELRHAWVGGHAPVLAPPVEPAPREPPDRLVQLLVEREVEDDLGVSRVVREEPDAARGGTGLGRWRLRHELTRLATLLVGTRRPAGACKNPTAPGRARRGLLFSSRRYERGHGWPRSRHASPFQDTACAVDRRRGRGRRSFRRRRRALRLAHAHARHARRRRRAAPGLPDRGRPPDGPRRGLRPAHAAGAARDRARARAARGRCGHASRAACHPPRGGRARHGRRRRVRHPAARHQGQAGSDRPGDQRGVRRPAGVRAAFREEGDRGGQRDRPRPLQVGRRAQSVAGRGLRLLRVGVLRAPRRRPARRPARVGRLRPLGVRGARSLDHALRRPAATCTWSWPGCASTPAPSPAPARAGPPRRASRAASP